MNRTARHNSNRALPTDSRGGGSDRRAGSTLTEVLVALLIMSIGIVSLTTLFPLSILRSLRAAQLTRGTDLANNAKSTLALFVDANNTNFPPRMITDPDLDGVTNPYPAFYVIDPLGWSLSNAVTGGSPATFGNLGSGTPYDTNIVGLVNTGGTHRYNFNHGSPSYADNFVRLPDSWNQVYEDFSSNPVVGSGANGYTQLDVNNLSGAGFALGGGVTYRAVIFSADGTSSQSRTLTSASGNTITWSEDINNSGALNGTEDLNSNGVLDSYTLPGNFTPGLVRIDANERRYTWLLTIRKLTSATQGEVDVVVFFGREEANPVGDETLYQASFVKGSWEATVTYSGTAPPIKRGGFVFDAVNAHWYRITAINPDPLPATGATVTLSLEMPALAGTGTGYAMFPKGVVDVFPLGPKP
jgi:hypothetical protein